MSASIPIFPILVAEELRRAREKHPQNILTRHEAFSVILEELMEFWAEVRVNEPSRDEMLKELVQVSAMAQRTAEDLKWVYD